MTLWQEILLAVTILLGSAVAGRMGGGKLLGCQPVSTTVPSELVSALAKELETLKSANQVSTQV